MDQDKADASNGESPKASGKAKPKPKDGAHSDAPRDDGDDSGKDDSRRGDEGGETGDDDGDDDDKSGADDDVEWEELYCCPLTVRFTQEKIHPFFYRRGPIVNVVPKIRLALPSQGSEENVANWMPGDPGVDDAEVYELVPPFAPIHCLRKGDELWSLDNRRLYALQLAAMEQWPLRCRVRLMYSERLPRRKLKTQWRKFQTTNEGRCIIVAARFQQFDTWGWFDRAVELEMYTFSQRLGIVLNVFEMLPVVGALLFRTGLTGFKSRVPFIAGFAITFFLDFMRQKVSIFERRICELHVKAVMEGDARTCDLFCKRQAGESAMSAPQLAACMVVVLTLVLPYVQNIQHEKLRSSIFSCWLGVACVLAVQTGMILKTRKAAETEYSGTNQKLTPKHRD